jgi:hypothetical protein
LRRKRRPPRGRRDGRAAGFGPRLLRAELAACSAVKVGRMDCRGSQTAAIDAGWRCCCTWVLSSRWLAWRWFWSVCIRASRHPAR